MVKKPKPKPKPGRPPRIVVCVALIDETGSMAPRLDEAISAYNAYLEGLNRSDATIYLRTYLFDRFGMDPIVRSLGNEVTLASAAPKLSKENYHPRGNTPLYDSIAAAISEAERMQHVYSAEKVMLMVQTDGEENSSCEYSYTQIRQLISAKHAVGWEVLFLAQDLGERGYQVAQSLGIRRQSTMSYSGVRGMSTDAFYAAGQNMGDWASGAAASADFTSEQKSAAGDTYEPKPQPQPQPKPQPKPR